MSKKSCTFAAQNCKKEKNMPFVMPIEVQIPPTLVADKEFLQQQVSCYAQALVDNMSLMDRPHRQMTAAQGYANSLSVDESEARIDNLINTFYSTKA